MTIGKIKGRKEGALILPTEKLMTIVTKYVVSSWLIKYLVYYQNLIRCTQRNFVEILSNQPEIRLYLLFSD